MQRDRRGLQKLFDDAASITLTLRADSRPEIAADGIGATVRVTQDTTTRIKNGTQPPPAVRKGQATLTKENGRWYLTALKYDDAR